MMDEISQYRHWRKGLFEVKFFSIVTLDDDLSNSVTSVLVLTSITCIAVLNYHNLKYRKVEINLIKIQIFSKIFFRKCVFD